MNHYVQIENSKVHTIMPSISLIVKVDTEDKRLLGTTYDEATGTFTGYRIALTVDKPTITADGVDTATITATVTNWDDTPANFNENIIFEVNGQQVTEPAVGGVASIPFTSLEAGVYSVVTKNEGYVMKNGSVEVTANA